MDFIKMPTRSCNPMLCQAVGSIALPGYLFVPQTPGLNVRLHPELAHLQMLLLAAALALQRPLAGRGVALEDHHRLLSPLGEQLLQTQTLYPAFQCRVELRFAGR